MDFSDKELKVVLQALYRMRGEVAGYSQSEQNKLGLVETVIGRIEGRVGPLRSERTSFDREMEESLSAMMTGKAGSRVKASGNSKKISPAEPKKTAKTPAKAAYKAAPKPAAKKGGAKAKPSLDRGAAKPKVKKEPGASKAAASGKKTK